MNTFWITFYSYKGGVGRTLALANVGALLAKNGRRVVLIDFDLEAPGLDSFKAFHKSKGKPGVVEYVSKFWESRKAPKISDHVFECPLEAPVRGKLWVMPAGKKDPTYNKKRVDIPWSQLFESGMGRPFIDNWKAAIENEYKPDYVLVDSRTGLTDVGGICTLGFPDLVVMLFSLNEQNLHGTASVAEAITKADPERTPQICYVATPIPNLTADSSPIIKKRYKQAGEILGSTIEATIGYYSGAALEEKLFVLEEEHPRPKIIGDYEQLIEKVTQFNRSGLEFLSNQVDLACSNPDDERVSRLIAVLKRDYSGRGEGNYLLSRLYASIRDIPQALEYSHKALKLEPTFQPAFKFLQSQLEAQRKYKEIVTIIENIELQYSNLGEERLNDLMTAKGQYLMALKDYPRAVDSYSTAKKTLSDCKVSIVSALVANFNETEADRRATGIPNKAKWQKIIRLFEHSGSAGQSSPPEQANQFQAIHIAYACVGDIDYAKEILFRAEKAAKTVSEIDDLFCVKSYQNQPRSVFLEDNKEMMASLEKGQLWDGMKLQQK